MDAEHFLGEYTACKLGLKNEMVRKLEIKEHLNEDEENKEYIR